MGDTFPRGSEALQEVRWCASPASGADHARRRRRRRAISPTRTFRRPGAGHGNREKAKAKAKAWAAANRGLANGYSRAWVAANPERRKAIRKASAAARYRANPEEMRARAKAWYAAHPERARELGRRSCLKRHGLTQAAYDALLAEQSAACRICRSTKPGGNGGWHVDHDHACCPGQGSCGRCVRGLLCSSCNLLLGHAGDDSEILRRAIEYLEAPRARQLKLASGGAS